MREQFKPVGRLSDNIEQPARFFMLTPKLNDLVAG